MVVNLNYDLTRPHLAGGQEEALKRDPKGEFPQSVNVTLPPFHEYIDVWFIDVNGCPTYDQSCRTPAKHTGEPQCLTAPEGEFWTVFGLAVPPPPPDWK